MQDGEEKRGEGTSKEKTGGKKGKRALSRIGGGRVATKPSAQKLDSWRCSGWVGSLLGGLHSVQREERVPGLLLGR